MTAPQGAGLVLEVGRSYLTRDGQVVTVGNSEDRRQPFCGFVPGIGILEEWCEDGRYYDGPTLTSGFDLIAESPASAPGVPVEVSEALARMDGDRDAAFVDYQNAQKSFNATVATEAWPFYVNLADYDTVREYLRTFLQARGEK